MWKAKRHSGKTHSGLAPVLSSFCTPANRSTGLLSSHRCWIRKLSCMSPNATSHLRSQEFSHNHVSVFLSVSAPALICVCVRYTCIHVHLLKCIRDQTQNLTPIRQYSRIHLSFKTAMFHKDPEWSAMHVCTVLSAPFEGGTRGLAKWTKVHMQSSLSSDKSPNTSKNLPTENSESKGTYNPSSWELLSKRVTTYFVAKPVPWAPTLGLD